MAAITSSKLAMLLSTRMSRVFCPFADAKSTAIFRSAKYDLTLCAKTEEEEEV